MARWHPTRYLRHGLWIEQFLPAEDERIRKGVEAGRSFSAIGKELHRGRHTVYCRAVHLGLHKPKRYRRVTSEQKALISSLATSGFNARGIARVVGLAHATVWDVMRRASVRRSMTM